MDDPYHDFKTVHKANLMSSRGDVSPLCAAAPKALNLRRETWTLVADDVTCAKCLQAMGVAEPRRVAKERRQRRMDAVSRAEGR